MQRNNTYIKLNTNNLDFHKCNTQYNLFKLQQVGVIL